MEYVELKHVLTGNILRFKSDDLPSGKYKIFIPKGTANWRTGVTAWLSDEPSSSLMSLDSPPTSDSVVDMSADTRLVLQKLWEGVTVSTYAIPRSQSLGLCQSEVGMFWRADRDRWIYLDLAFASGQVQSITSNIEIDANFAPIPTSPPQVTIAPAPLSVNIDPFLLERTRQYVNQSGYTDAIKKFGGFGDGYEQEVALVAKGTESGLVKALTEMVRLAELNKK